MDSYYAIRDTMPPIILEPNTKLTSLGTRVCELNDVTLLSKPGLVFSQSLPRAVKQAKRYLKEKYRFHEIIVHSQQNFLFLSRDVIGTGSPFDLPINKVRLDNNNIFTGASLLEAEIEGKLVFDSINMRYPGTTLSGPQYTHELTHTQIDSLKGILKLHNHHEVMSMLIELIYAFELDNTLCTLRAFEIYRSYEFATGINDLILNQDVIDASVYLTSDLIALNLFIIYYNSSTAIRREMIRNIQRVLDGQLTVEDFIEIYDASYEACLENGKLEQHLSKRKKG